MNEIHPMVPPSWTRTSLVVVIDIDDDGATNGRTDTLRVYSSCSVRVVYRYTHTKGSGVNNNTYTS